MFAQPYVFFDGRADEAFAFYRQALGAEIEMLMRYKENPDASNQPPGLDGNKVMHACLKIGDTRIMASDGHCTGQPNFQGFALALSVSSEAEAERTFGALADGGQVRMPLTKTFFSPRFGMLTDRFGVMWMVIVGQ